MACDLRMDGPSPPSSAARRPVQPYNSDLHDKWLSPDLKRAAESIAKELWNKTDRKQTRIAFEKYVTHCIVLESLQVKTKSVVGTDATSDEQSEHPFEEKILSLDEMVAEGSTAVPWTSKIDHATTAAATDESMCHSVEMILPQRVRVECDEPVRAVEATPATPIVSAKSCSTVRAAEASFAELWDSFSHPSDSLDTMRGLRKTNETLYAQVLNSHRDIEQAAFETPLVISALASVPRSAWVTVFDSSLWGPFTSSDEAISCVRRYATHPRTPITWQVGMQDCDAGTLDTVTVQPPETPFVIGTRLKDHTPASFGGDARPCTDIFVAAKGYDSDDDSASDSVKKRVALFDTGSMFDMLLPSVLFNLVTDSADWVRTRVNTATDGAETYKAPVIMQELWAEHTASGSLPAHVRRRVSALRHPKASQQYAIVGPSALLPQGEFILRADGMPIFARAS